jgi:hypothetical protein
MSKDLLPASESPHRSLEQPEDVVIGVGDGGHQAAATDVARRLLHAGAHRGHLGQLRLEVRNMPVGGRRGHALRSTARYQADVLALCLEADVFVIGGDLHLGHARCSSARMLLDS